MTYVISTFHGLSKEKIGEAPTFAAAEEFAKARYTMVCFEPDAANAGCADFFTTTGAVGCIEPAEEKTPR
jgi:ABC-type uncharacterized transport system permease subunit